MDLWEIFGPKPESQVASEAQDTPDWIKQWVKQYQPQGAQPEKFVLSTVHWILLALILYLVFFSK